MAKSISLEAFMRAREKQMDEAHLDPGQRAELVNTFIHYALGLTKREDVIEQPLYWDLLCYSFQMISRFAIQAADPDFLQIVKALNSYMNSIHYSGELGQEDWLGPEREEHEGIWVDRIEFVKEAVEWKTMEDTP